MRSGYEEMLRGMRGTQCSTPVNERGVCLAGGAFAVLAESGPLVTSLLSQL